MLSKIRPEKRDSAAINLNLYAHCREEEDMGAHERWWRMTLTTTTSRCRSVFSSSSVSSFSNDVFRRLSSSSSSSHTKMISSSEGRSFDDYAEKERRMCSSNSRASTSGRRTSLNTNNIKNKNNINRRMFASDASPVSSTIVETKKKKKKKSKNAAASTASLSAESSNEDEETVDENENDSDVNENKEDKSSRLVFTSSGDENDTFRGNKAGRLSTQAISKRGGGQEGAAGKQSRTSFYKPMTSRAQIDGMNCEQLLEEIKQRFQSKKKPFLGGGNVPAAAAATKTKTGEKGGQNHPRTEFEPSTIEIEGFKHEISERLASFLRFGEGESGVKATRRFVDRRLKSYCEEMNLFVGERDEREKKVKRMKDPENPGKWEDRRFVLDTKLRQLFQTPDEIDQLSFRKRTKAEEEGEFLDGVAPVSLFLDPHFVDITDQDASQLVQSKTYGSNVIVKKNNRVYAVRESALKILLQRVRSPKDVQYALEAVALFHMERAAMGKTRGLGFERAYEFIKACCDVKSYETAIWACEQSRSLGLNLSRKTLSLLLWHLLDTNRPLEEVLRVYSVIRNLKLGVDGKSAQFVVKSALQHGHVNAAAGYCVQFMQAGVKVNRKTPTAIMNAAIEHNLPNAAVAVERCWNKEQPQLPKAPFDRLALAQAYALLADDDECTKTAKSILDTLDDAFDEELKNTTSQKLALWPQKLLGVANEAKGGASKEILERCKRGMTLIKNACEGELFHDVDVEYAFSTLQILDDEDEDVLEEKKGEE